MTHDPAADYVRCGHPGLPRSARADDSACSRRRGPGCPTCFFGDDRSGRHAQEQGRYSAGDRRPGYVSDDVRGLASPQSGHRLHGLDSGATRKRSQDDGRCPTDREHREEGVRSEQECVEQRLRGPQRQARLNQAGPPHAIRASPRASVVAGTSARLAPASPAEAMRVRDQRRRRAHIMAAGASTRMPTPRVTSTLVCVITIRPMTSMSPIPQDASRAGRFHRGGKRHVAACRYPDMAQSAMECWRHEP